MHASTVHGCSSSASARAGTDTSSTHHMHACTHVQRGYTKSGLYWLEVKGASGHRRAAQIAANLDDWTQRGPEKERGEAGPSGGSLGYCDMTSMGGGWLMCYTSQGEVDVANEVASRMRLRMCMAVPPRIAPSEHGGIHARSLAACTCACALAPVPTDETTPRTCTSGCPGGIRRTAAIRRGRI